MKKIVITGGAGMIGSNLTEVLLERDNEIICIDNFYSGGRKNVENFLANPNYRLLEWDVVKPFDLEINEVDEIYHLAAPASPVAYQRDPIFTLRTIVTGTDNALDCARRHNAKILVTSTSEIYGQPLVHPQSEEYLGNVSTTGIRACYDEGKRCSETFCAEYRRIFGTDVKIARLFNTFGPYMDIDDGRVVSEFIVNMLRDEPLPVFGDGTQTRAFCYVADTIRGLIALMESDESGPVNIGNPIEMQINEFLKHVENCMGKKAKIKWGDLPQDDPLQRCPDISLAKEKLNWQPEVSLEDGLKKTIEYFRDVISIN